MSKEEKISFILGGIITTIFMIVVLITALHSLGTDKITWCHCEPNGNCQTLMLPEQALNGHKDAEGNPLHAGDHAGVCEEVIPTPSITVVPTEIENTPTAGASATPILPSETPVVTQPVTSGGGSDGRSDGLGCSTHDCNTFPHSSYDNAKVGWK